MSLLLAPVIVKSSSVITEETMFLLLTWVRFKIRPHNLSLLTLVCWKRL